MKLLLVTDGPRTVWLAALHGEDLYSYVPNTGRFHLNSAVRHDYFMEREMQYAEIGVTEARRLIGSGLPELDEDLMEDPLQDWRLDPNPLGADEVLAAAAADLA